MTIDEALSNISDSGECYLVWNASTGEILSVTALASGAGPEDHIRLLMQPSTHSGPTTMRFLPSAMITHPFLEQQAADILSRKRRGEILIEWAHLPVAELLVILEEGGYDPPMNRNDSRFIVEHLWEVHRRELTLPVQERLRQLAHKSDLPEITSRALRIYLAALEGDADRLTAIWKAERLPIYTEALLDAFAQVRTQDPEVIEAICALFETGIPFGAKYDTMIALGKIGPGAGPQAAEAIRAHIYDSKPDIIAARERVLARLEDGEEVWIPCEACCCGRLHPPADGFASQNCPHCLGIGYRPLA